MFVSLGNVLAGFAGRHKIKNQINKINIIDVSESIIKNIINTEIKVVWCKNNCILLKTKTGAAANEVKLKDWMIKTELQKNSIHISSIKCII